MVRLFRKFKIFREKIREKRKVRKLLALFLRKTAKEKTAPQSFLRIFLETKDAELRKNTFRKLKRLFFRLSFTNDIFPALAPEKMKDAFKEEFWKMVLKFEINDSEQCAIARSSDFFFAKKAFDELLKKYEKRKIRKDRIKNYLIDIMTWRSEFVSDSWQILKRLNPSYKDMLSIKDSKNYQLDIYQPIRDEIEEIFVQLRRKEESTERTLRRIINITRKKSESN